MGAGQVLAVGQDVAPPRPVVISLPKFCDGECPGGAACNARTGECVDENDFQPIASLRRDDEPTTDDDVCSMTGRINGRKLGKPSKVNSCELCDDECTSTEGCVGWSFKIPKRNGKRSKCQLYSTVKRVKSNRKFNVGGSAVDED